MPNTALMPFVSYGACIGRFQFPARVMKQYKVIFIEIRANLWASLEFDIFLSQWNSSAAIGNKVCYRGTEINGLFHRTRPILSMRYC